MNFTEFITASGLAENSSRQAEVTTSQVLLTTAADVNAPLFIMKKISGDIPEFEIILPCIFGIFIVLSLGLMVFYTKTPKEERAKEAEIDKEINNEENDGKVDSSWF